MLTPELLIHSLFLIMFGSGNKSHKVTNGINKIESIIRIFFIIYQLKRIKQCTSIFSRGKSKQNHKKSGKKFDKYFFLNTIISD
jgi:hypothetical protein